jgi:hypothetical protein
MQRIIQLQFVIAMLLSAHVQAFDVFMREVQIGPLCSYQIARLANDTELSFPPNSKVLESKGYDHGDYTALYARYLGPADIRGAVNGMFASIMSNTNAVVSDIRCVNSSVPNAVGMQCEANIALGGIERVLVALVVRSLKHPDAMCQFSAFYDKQREQYDHEKALSFIATVEVLE